MEHLGYLLLQLIYVMQYVPTFAWCLQQMYLEPTWSMFRLERTLFWRSFPPQNRGHSPGWQYSSGTNSKFPIPEGFLKLHIAPNQPPNNIPNAQPVWSIYLHLGSFGGIYTWANEVYILIYICIYVGKYNSGHLQMTKNNQPTNPCSRDRSKTQEPNEWYTWYLPQGG